jgi:uncharacterized membrane protein
MTGPTGDVEEPRPGIGLSRFQLAVALLMLLAGILVYPHLPPRIPMHWNVRGAIDSWGARNLFNVFFQPLLVIGFAFLAWWLPGRDPLKRSYGRFRGSYYLIIDMVVAFMALLYGISLYSAFRPTLPVGIIVPAAIGLLFAVIGNQLSKVKRNFFMGIRTPWTLSSEAVWVRTHRVGGRIFMLCGLGAAAAAFLPAPWNAIVFMVLVIGGALAMVIASYLIHHQLEAQGKLGDRIGGPGRE